MTAGPFDVGVSTGRVVGGDALIGRPSIHAQLKSTHQEMAEGPPVEATTTIDARSASAKSGQDPARYGTSGAPPIATRVRPIHAGPPHPAAHSETDDHAILPPPTNTTRPEPDAAHITGMACRNCGLARPLALEYVCPACFGPLEVTYDLGVVARTLTREAIAGRAPGIWRYIELLPVDGIPTRSLAVGSTPLVAADRLAPLRASIACDRDDAQPVVVR
jgi:hypothetical protein